jgi:UDP:flavonoid glycosyltransferase YjiC (YdhE family)
VATATKTVLLINELGAGYGHVAPLLRVGTALAEHGARVVCAMADVVRPGLLLRRAGFPVLQAPKWPGVRAEKGSSYGDLLALLGFDSVPALMLMTSAWQDLFDLVVPDLIIANHSPTAALTARGSIPLALMGNGFELPPTDMPAFPSLKPGVAPLADEAKLLETVTEVQRHRGRDTPPTLPSVFAAEYRGICVLPELDPYGEQRSGEPVLGPVEPLPTYRPRPDDRSVFAYIGVEHPDLYEISAGLGAADADVTCHVRGDPGTIGALLTERGVTVLVEPADLIEVLPASAAVVGYASAGIAQAALAAGPPQLALPYDLEKDATAAALDRLGVSRTLGVGIMASQVCDALDAVLSEDRYAHHAAVCAQSIMGRGPTDALGTIVEACLTLLD